MKPLKNDVTGVRGRGYTKLVTKSDIKGRGYMPIVTSRPPKIMYKFFFFA